MHHFFCTLLCKSGKTGWGLAVLSHCSTSAGSGLGSTGGGRGPSHQPQHPEHGAVPKGAPRALDAAEIHSSSGEPEPSTAGGCSSSTPARHSSHWGNPQPKVAKARSCLTETGCSQSSVSGGRGQPCLHFCIVRVAQPLRGVRNTELSSDTRQLSPCLHLWPSAKCWE